MLWKVLIAFADGNLILEFQKKFIQECETCTLLMSWFQDNFLGIIQIDTKRQSRTLSLNQYKIFEIFKACVLYFYFSKRKPSKNYEKCFLFHLKTLFVLGIFKLLLFSLFLFNVLKSWSTIIMTSWNDLHQF